MKWLRIATNWTFIVVMFPFVCLVLFYSAVVEGVKHFASELTAGYKDLYNMFTDDYVNKRREWLVEGNLWPLQTKKRKRHGGKV